LTFLQTLRFLDSSGTEKESIKVVITMIRAIKVIMAGSLVTIMTAVLMKQMKAILGTGMIVA
jgi:hypothetical protein